MNLSPQQVEAYDAIMAWYKGPEQTFALSGYAGTGKTTLAKHIANSIDRDRTIFCAYTGKAAHVLRQKGCENSGTIHSFLYEYIGTDESGEPVFGVKETGALMTSKLVIVDEYSMIDADIIEDLQSHGKKILYLGDPFQLPPTKGKCTITTNFLLTEIHRQALESPILRAAHHVREGNVLQFTNTDERFIYMPEQKISREKFLGVDQVIVGKNTTKHDFNKRFRKHLYGIEDDLYPVCGEKIMCLRNNNKIGIYNGMMGKSISIEVADSSGRLDFKSDDRNFKEIKVWLEDFYRDPEQGKIIPMKYNRFGYGYAITCHKSQGSEFDSVLIYNQPVGSTQIDRQRWLYTALTRASKKAILVQPK